jgi:hypothetical protein
MYGRPVALVLSPIPLFLIDTPLALIVGCKLKKAPVGTGASTCPTRAF